LHQKSTVTWTSGPIKQKYNVPFVFLVQQEVQQNQ